MQASLACTAGVFIIIFLFLFSGDAQTCACVVFSLFFFFFFFAEILWNVAAGDRHSWKRRSVSGDFAPQIGAETHALLRHIARLSLFYYLLHLFFFCLCVCFFSPPTSNHQMDDMKFFLGKFSPSLLFISPRTTSFVWVKRVILLFFLNVSFSFFKKCAASWFKAYRAV